MMDLSMKIYRHTNGDEKISICSCSLKRAIRKLENNEKDFAVIRCFNAAGEVKVLVNLSHI